MLPELGIAENPVFVVLLSNAVDAVIEAGLIAQKNGQSLTTFSVHLLLGNAPPELLATMVLAM